MRVAGARGTYYRADLTGGVPRAPTAAAVAFGNQVPM